VGARHPNPRRLKIHRSYTVEQLAAALNNRKKTSHPITTSSHAMRRPHHAGGSLAAQSGSVADI
jgi:hypothetical protein